MKRRRVLTAAPFLIVFAGPAHLQTFGRHRGREGCEQSLYEAVVVVDDGTAMDKVWAHKPYVTYVGPKSTSIIVGWDAQKTYWPEFNKAFTRRTVELVATIFTWSGTSHGRLAPRSGRRT